VWGRERKCQNSGAKSVRDGAGGVAKDPHGLPETEEGGGGGVDDRPVDAARVGAGRHVGGENWIFGKRKSWGWGKRVEIFDPRSADQIILDRNSP